jgi:hypothetical protein
MKPASSDYSMTQISHSGRYFSCCVSIVIKGGILKSRNQYYNKEKAQLQSIYDKQGIKFGTRSPYGKEEQPEFHSNSTL